MAEITIQATADIADATLDANLPTTNYASDNTIYAGHVATTYRLAIKFDLSDIPAGATINSAVLSIRASVDNSTNARTFRVYRVLRAWTEAGITWNKYDGISDWGTAGCSNTTTDREAADIGSRAFTATETLNEFKDLTLTASAIQEMITGGAFTNNGFLIQADTESADNYGFNSSENGTEGNNPKLVVTYTSGGGTLDLTSKSW